MKIVAYIGGLLGLVLLLTLVIRADFAALLQAFMVAGWRLLWLVPYRLLFFALYAAGWLGLLRPGDPQHRAGFGYLLWVTTVREAIDRLLPVASVGGGVVAVRLLRWCGLAVAPAAASVVVEVLLTLIVAYLFTALGLLLLIQVGAPVHDYHRMIIVFLLTLPVPIVMALVLHYGSVFQRLHGMLRFLVGETAMSEAAASLDEELRASLRRRWSLIVAGVSQFAAFLSGSFEIWFVLRLCGHPISVTDAVILESMTQAVRHVAFVIPAAVGVQEAGLVLFGHALGINSELALAVSMAKRLREVLCGLPSLISWQWLEGSRLQRASGSPS